MNIGTRRLGRFLVSARWFSDLENTDAAVIFDSMVVIRADYDLERYGITYLAYHPSFESVPEGAVIPTYKATFRKGATKATWVKE